MYYIQETDKPKILFKLFNIIRVKEDKIILPIRDLRDTSKVSELAHKNREPIHFTKNGYSDLVVMSSEYYDWFARENRIDQAIFEAEQEFAETGEAIDAEVAFSELEKKYFG